jgi:spore maturation protein CgeB
MGYGACCRDWFQQNLTTKTPIIVFLYKLSCNKNEKFRAIKNYPNIIPFSQHTRIPEFEKKYQIKLNPTLYPFDERLFHDYKLDKKYDVGMTGALHGAKLYAKEAYLEGEKNIRLKIVNKLKNSTLKTFIKISDVSAEASRIMNHVEYAKTINSSKMWIATNADHGDLTPRYCEVIACKTLLFCNEQPYDTFHHIFKDGETCVFFKNDLSDFIEKINYYLTHKEEYNKIVNNAYQLFHSNYTCKKIVEKYLKFAK